MWDDKSYQKNRNRAQNASYVVSDAYFPHRCISASQATEYPAASQIICGQLDGHIVSRNDADIELSDFS